MQRRVMLPDSLGVVSGVDESLECVKAEGQRARETEGQMTTASVSENPPRIFHPLSSFSFSLGSAHSRWFHLPASILVSVSSLSFCNSLKKIHELLDVPK